VNLATGVAYVRGSGGRRRARTNDVRRPAAGAGEGRGGGTARGLRRAAKPQSSLARLWLVIMKTVTIIICVVLLCCTEKKDAVAAHLRAVSVTTIL